MHSNVQGISTRKKSLQCASHPLRIKHWEAALCSFEPMDPATKGKMSTILQSKDGANTKLEKILALLTLANLCYGITLRPDALLCHPQNRGSQMINPYDCHKKGSAILFAGLKPDLLPPNSVCIEMATDPEARSAQVGANQQMMAEADGMLGKVNNGERFLTLGNSHMVMFCRACEQGGKSPSGEPLHTPPELQQLLQEGWQWKAISSLVEKEFPTFPAFCQAALNSTNSTSISTAELESMLQLSTYVQKGSTMTEALAAVEAAQPACSMYLKDIAHFCQYYSGGTAFPLLAQLKQFCILSALLFLGNFEGKVLCSE